MPPAVQEALEKVSIIVEASYQFSGTYPEVPIAPDVNIDELTASDREAGYEPFFITLPLGEVGQVSQNRRRYVGDVAVRAIFKAITEQRIGGNKGHTPNMERDTFFDVPVLHWVGAVIDERGVAWGKAYVPADSERMREMRGYYKRQMATNGRVGTSLEGVGYQEYNSQDEIYDITELDVYRIDAVEALQVGVKRAGMMPPKITSEKAGETPAPITEAKLGDLAVGDFVKFERDGVLCYGEVNTIFTTGEVEIPYQTNLTITASEDEPIARIYVWNPNWQGEGWVRSDWQVLQKFSALTKTEALGEPMGTDETVNQDVEGQIEMADKPITGEALTELQVAQASLAEIQTQLAEAKAQAAVLANIAEALGGAEKPLEAVRAVLAERDALREETKKLMETAVEQAVDAEAKIVSEAINHSQAAVQGFGKTVRGMIKAFVAQEAIAKKEDIAPAIKRVLEREDVKNLLESTRVLVMGPNVETPFEEHQEGDASLEAVTYS
jgi:hypothetical protein